MFTTTAAAPEPRISPQCQGFVTHLVLRCGRGDESALGDLFDLTYFLVARVVNRGSCSVTGADEDVVEAFRRIWLQSPTYQPSEQPVLAWVFDQVVDSSASESSHERQSVCVAT